MFKAWKWQKKSKENACLVKVSNEKHFLKIYDTWPHYKNIKRFIFSCLWGHSQGLRFAHWPPCWVPGNPWGPVATNQGLPPPSSDQWGAGIDLSFTTAGVQLSISCRKTIVFLPNEFNGHSITHQNITQPTQWQVENSVDIKDIQIYLCLGFLFIYFVFCIIEINRYSSSGVCIKVVSEENLNDYCSQYHDGLRQAALTPSRPSQDMRIWYRS